MTSTVTGEICQFPGETAWDAIVNHFSLDIEEEAAFERFCEQHGVSKDAPLMELEAAYRRWQAGFLGAWSINWKEG